MTRKLSLTTVIAGAALVFAAPALGVIPVSGDGAGSERLHPAIAAQLALESNVGTYRDAHERGAATNPSQSAVTGYRDANERGSVAVLGERGTSSIVAGYHDAFERAAAYERARSSAVASYRDAFERAVPPTTAPAPLPVTSGNDIEWPQVGVGLGIGILLALGLGLIVRAVHIRPFAH